MIRVALLALAALAGCGNQHLVGSVIYCCFDQAANALVPRCEKLSSCTCTPELCGAGSACQSDDDCPKDQVGLDKFKVPCISCVKGRCAASCALPPTPSGSCNSDAQCGQLGGCTTCTDGSMSCYVVRCRDGACATEPPSCGCRKDADCPLTNDWCSRCPDGVHTRCLEARCANGACLVQPGAACPPAVSCKVDADCGKSECVSCADGSVCGRAWCFEGGCEIVRPSCPT